MSDQAIELRKYLTLGQAEFGKAIRGAISPELLIRTAITYCQKTPKVLDCTRESIAKCLMDCAALGLLPDGTLGTAYLVPYGKVCTLIVGYRGLIELARRSGQLSSIEAHAVREGDEFRCEFGLEPLLKHSPSLVGGEGRPLVAVYAIARFKDGSHHVEVMSKGDVDAIRSRSRASGSGPWVTDYSEMAKKTVVRRMMKYLPLSPDMAEVFDAADREYVQDAEVTEVAPEKPSKKADKLAKQLKHEPQVNIADDIARAEAEREAADAAAIPVRTVNSETPASEPEAVPPAAEGASEPAEIAPDELVAATKIFVRQKGKIRVTRTVAEMDEADWNDAYTEAKAVLDNPDEKAPAKNFAAGVIKLLEKHPAKVGA